MCVRRPSQQADPVQPSPMGGLVDAAATPAANPTSPNSIFRRSRWLENCGMSALPRLRYECSAEVHEHGRFCMPSPGLECSQ